MKQFQLEVNGLCNNGARVIAVYKELHEGVVLARWNWQYVTWSFATKDQASTTAGHYYRYDESEASEQEAFKEAYTDFLDRIKRLHGEEAKHY